MFLQLGLNAQDVVVIENGDKLNGAIKELAQDVLEFDTEYGQKAFQLDWEDVIGLETTSLMSIELNDGTRLTGTIATDPNNPDEMIAVTADGPVRFPRDELFHMNDMRRTFSAGWAPTLTWVSA